MTGGVPDAFWIGSAAALGAVVGSFLNVCIYRMPRRCMTIAYPRHSKCPKCGHAIRWYENIPVVSWVFLLGRCSGCRTPISPLYPAVEALTALVFAVAAHFALGSPPDHDAVLQLAPWHGVAPLPWMRIALFAVSAWFCASLIVATFVDFEFQIIPDQISVTGAWLAPFVSLALPWIHAPILRLMPLNPDHAVRTEDLVAPLQAWSPHLEGLLAALLGAAVGAGSIYVVGVLGKIVFRKEAMGFGDVKLMAFVGGILGWKAALMTFFIACFVGSFVGIAQLLAVKAMNAFRKEGAKFDHYLAFGPYLAIGGLAMFFFYDEVDRAVFITYPAWLKGLAGA